MPKMSKETAANIKTITASSKTATRTSMATPSSSSRSARTRTAPHFMKGLPNDMCHSPHWGYMLKGRITFRFADHEEVVEAGDAFYLPPGHVPVVDAGTEYVQFSPSEQLHEVAETMIRNMEAMRAG